MSMAQSERNELDGVRDNVKALNHQVDTLVGEVRRLQEMLHAHVEFPAEIAEAEAEAVAPIGREPKKGKAA